MGYEERYKELFSKLVSARFDKSKKGCAFCTVIDSIMSELAESESDDERIRKELICYFEKYPSIVIGPFNTKECIAWLEKQGEHAKFRDSIQVGDKVTRNQDGVLVNLSQLKRVAKKDEKQGEQKPADKVEPKFKVGDTVTVKPMSCHGKVFKGEPFKIVDIIEDNYVSNDGKTYSISLQDGWELVEQKPDTQHSTEWSVSDFRTWQYIVSDVLTKKDGIGQYLDSGECIKIAKYMQEEWSKKLNIEQKHTELLKGEDYGIDGLYHAIDILERTLGKVSGYQSDDGILEHKAAMTAVKKLYKQKPVELEKEEKSRLMKKCVHKAYQQGYDTGFHMATTELEHKQEWSEEDDKMINSIAVHLNATTGGFPEDRAWADKFMIWLKSLKDRVQPQPKQEWGEEDEEIFNAIQTIFIDYDKNHCLPNIATKYGNWLKSLRPQNTWKPSDEQMKVLNEVLNFAANHESPHWNDYIFGTLNNLIRQLKKLREE